MPGADVIGAPYRAIATGTPAGLIAEWPAIINYLYHFPVSGNTPDVELWFSPTVFADFSPTYGNPSNASNALAFLVRSSVIPTTSAAASPVAPTAPSGGPSTSPTDYVTSVNNIYLSQLGVAADPDGLAYWTSTIAAGGASLGQLMQALAYSPSAQAAINTAWQDIVGSGVDATSLAFWQNAFSYGYGISSVIGGLAYSSGSVAAITNVYQSVLGRSPENGVVAATQTNLANGTTTIQALVMNAAQSQEAKDDIWATYMNVLGRPPSADEMTGTENNLAQGASTIQTLKTNAAYSQEVQNDITYTYDNLLWRNPTPAETSSIEANLSTGATTIQGMKGAIAYSAEAQGDIGYIWLSQTGSYIDQGSLAYWEQALVF